MIKKRVFTNFRIFLYQFSDFHDLRQVTDKMSHGMPILVLVRRSTASGWKVVGETYLLERFFFRMVGLHIFRNTFGLSIVLRCKSSLSFDKQTESKE